MRLMLLACAACVMAFASPAFAQKMTKAQAQAECRAMHGGAAGVRNADRTGVTVAQAVQRCVARKMGGKK